MSLSHDRTHALWEADFRADYIADRGRNYESPAATVIVLMICVGCGLWLLLGKADARA